MEERKSNDFIKERTEVEKEEERVMYAESKHELLNSYILLDVSLNEFLCFIFDLVCGVCVQRNSTTKQAWGSKIFIIFLVCSVYVQVDYTAAENSKDLIYQDIFACLLYLSLQQRIREADTREQNYSRNVKETGKSVMEVEKIWRSHIFSHLAKESIHILFERYSNIVRY